ncbi:MAG: Crp/Fnr family transcriptional regulator [Coriobacteriia bacterium]
MGCPLRESCFLSFACDPSIAGSSAVSVEHRRLRRDDSLWIRYQDDEVHVVRSGVVVTYRYSASGDMIPSLLHGTGQTIGEMCLFTGYGAVYNATAITDVDLCTMRRSTVEALMRDHMDYVRSSASAAFLTVLGIFQYSELMGIRDTHDRLKRLLYLLFEKLDEGKAEVTLLVTHDILASLIHSNRVTVTRALHDLEGEGFVRADHRRLVLIVDRQSDEYRSITRATLEDR